MGRESFKSISEDRPVVFRFLRVGVTDLQKGFDRDSNQEMLEREFVVDRERGRVGQVSG